MHILIVTAHPDADSLTAALGRAVAQGVKEAGGTSEIADLAAEGFDPRFTAGDLDVHRGRGSPPADVRGEQARLDRADAVVLVYPVYWWSFPALLKGWIDRVFTSGWAYEEDAAGTIIDKRLRHLAVHLIALGGAGLRTYARRGYFGAMKLQIDHGIFDYCGAPVASSELLAGPDPDEALAVARSIGHKAALATKPARRAA